MIKFANDYTAQPSRVPAIWGDGLLDQSLRTSWYAKDWDGVDLDELTIFIPALVASSGDTGRGPARHIRNALAAHVSLLSGNLQRYWRLESQEGGTRACSMIDETGMVTAGRANTLRDEAVGDLDIANFKMPMRPLSSDTRGAFVYQVAVVSTLDRVLRDTAMTAQDRSSSSACNEADILIASIHSRVNGAYIYSKWGFAHELFSAGAWLGVLLSGRSALLPEFLAEVFNELFERAAVKGEANLDACDRVLLSYIDVTAGRDSLSRHAKRVRATSFPVVVKSRRLTFKQQMPFVWNVELFGIVTKRLAGPSWNF